MALCLQGILRDHATLSGESAPPDIVLTQPLSRKLFLHEREAKERFGSDPRVQFTAVFNSDSPEERSQWLDQLKQAAPDNALPNYLRAFDDLKAGRTEQGVQELTAAAGKAGFEDYALDFIQSAEEAYRSAGCSEAEAKMIAGMGLPLPHSRNSSN